MTVRFEEAVYSVVESEVAVVCVIADGRIDSPFTVSAITSDITAVGRSQHSAFHIVYWCVCVCVLCVCV